MKKFFNSVLLAIFLLIHVEATAAPAYAFRVTFKDKNGTLSFADSSSFLTPKALLRRSKQGIMLDSSDLPVVQSYIDTVMQTASAAKLHNVSKWFNQIVVITYDSSKVHNIASLPMVASVRLVARYANGIWKTDESPMKKLPEVETELNKTTGTSAYYGVSFQQMDIIQVDCLHDLGYRGEGMDIAILDDNFRYTNTCPVFDSIFIENRVKDTWSFIRDTSWVYVNVPNHHGMNVLSNIASNIPGTFVGSAPKANFFLYITEDIATEQPIEEDNWVSAAERSDSLGIDVINTSLGYNVFDAIHPPYTYASMNGNTSLIARGANRAVSKGIFVVVAQGNEGANPWHYMLTPADADSVYSVGSVDGSGLWGQSGYGPTHDGRIKPDGVCIGKGVVIIGGNCMPGTTNGSSFAAPTIAGAVACLWQALPHLTHSQLRQLIKTKSSQYTNPNNTLGYGIPDFCAAYNLALSNPEVNGSTRNIIVYPNPSSQYFNVMIDDNYAGWCEVKIYSADGKLMNRSKKHKGGLLYISELADAPSGNYHVLISTPSKVYTTSLQKQ